MNSHLEIAKVPIKEIGNAIFNPQTPEQVDDLKEENSGRLASNKEIMEALNFLRKAVQHHADEQHNTA